MKELRLILLSVLGAAMWLTSSCTSSSREAEELYAQFQNPPAEAMPRVWWHWMDGNISKDGVKKDLEWMKRSHIAGFMNFDGAFNMPQIVPERVVYMTEPWKEVFAYTTHLADSLNLEMSVASSPGWSFTGGPWVEQKDAMKKVVWRELLVKGGQQVDVNLPDPYRTIGDYQNIARSGGQNFGGSSTDASPQGYYEDIAVLAVKLPDAEVDVASLNPTISSSGGKFDLALLTDGDLSKVGVLPAVKGGKAWIQYAFKEPQTMKALTIVDGRVRSEWQMPRVEVDKVLEVSDDGVNFREVYKIPNSSAPGGTVTFEPTTAKYFRVVFDNKEQSNPYAAMMGGSSEPRLIPTNVAELKFYPVYRINHAEEKAGYAAPADLYLYETPAESNVVALSDVVDVTSMVKDGHLSWNAPAGNWKIFRFGYSLTGKQNSPATREATGLEVDKMDATAVRAYFDHYLGMYKDASKDQLGSVIKYIMTDSYESGQENWTPLMMQEFETRRGYALLPWLPVLTGQIVGSSEESEKFLRDWRKTLGDLVTDNLYNQLTDILKERGMGRYTESQENGRVYLVDGMDVKAKSDVPMAAAWVPHNSAAANEPMSQADIREAASVAHIYGQNFVAGESLTAPGGEGRSYAYHPANLKHTADMELYSGLNRFVIHTSVHQPVDDKIPALGLGPIGQWFNRHEAWAETAWAWMDYLGRSSFMLQQGHYVADVVYYYGEDNCITGMFGDELPPVPSGYSFDFINSDALLNLLSVKNGVLTTPSGMNYRMLVLDKNVKYMRLPVLRKIAELVRGGAVIVGAKPEKPAGLNDDVAEFEQLVNEIWGGAQQNVYLNASMADVLNKLGIEPDVVLKDGVRFVHRTMPKTEIYWVNNFETTSKQVELSFRVKGMKPEVWHPETGAKEAVSYKIENGRTVVSLNLTPEDAVFVVFSGKAAGSGEQLPVLTENTLLTINTPWQVSFQEKRGAPASATFDKLIDFTQSEVDGIKYFSGVATYTNSFEVTEEQLAAKQLVLDLGDVEKMAEVTLNGQKLGAYWKAPFVVNVTDALKAGKNELEVKVSNLWINRMIGDSRPEVTEKISWTPYPFYRPTSQMSASGLIGPVRVIAKK